MLCCDGLRGEGGGGGGRPPEVRPWRTFCPRHHDSVRIFNQTVFVRGGAGPGRVKSWCGASGRHLTLGEGEGRRSAQGGAGTRGEKSIYGGIRNRRCTEIDDSVGCWTVLILLFQKSKMAICLSYYYLYSYDFSAYALFSGFGGEIQCGNSHTRQNNSRNQRHSYLHTENQNFRELESRSKSFETKSYRNWKSN